MLRRGRKLAKQVCRKAMRTVQAIKAKFKAMKIAAEMKQAQMTGCVQAVVAGTAAESYVDTGVKILIAVVIGALLLAGLYALFNGTIMPRVTEKITGLFNYNG